MDKYICIPEDETSTWYIHMQYFMTEKFGMKKIIYGKKYNKSRLNRVKSFFLIYKNIIRQIDNVDEGSQLFFFHPMPLFYKSKKVKIMLKKKEIVAIGFVCDIARLHLNDKDSKNFLKKVYAYLKDKLLKKFDLIMVPTSKMRDCLIDIGIESNRIIIHGLYDYHINLINKTREYTDNIIIAGDLTHDRNNYIYQLHSLKDLRFNLYGYGFDEKYKKSTISYFGMINESELNQKMCGKFGLCWYGDKLEESSGFSAEYMKINSPHKISLYIANEIPVIISDEAGVADYIREKHLGLLVHNLKELPDILNGVSDEEYTELLKHVKEEGRRLREGYHLEKSLSVIDGICNYDSDRR